MADRTPRIAFGDDAIESTRSAEDHIESLTYKKMASTHEIDADSFVSDRGVGVREGDMKKRQVFKGWTLLWLVYQSTGVIYGDIGTVGIRLACSTALLLTPRSPRSTSSPPPSPLRPPMRIYSGRSQSSSGL